ncbi:hypothetical protein RU86_GL001033 [Lactococcus piscium]|uniref:Integrase n=1 Tax=Pseudolactococcus piscium TaxID=1364 RepID=A0A2A5S572_9LACT|nr:tyrosine-type recombinase/integrase [Lactococcus piscium]PCS08649.1 hypothetical protein RU86_GL001033 [Lactococcus piscium]
MEINEYLKEYLLECKIRNYSAQTIKAKSIILNVLINYLYSEFGINDLEKIKKVHIQSYIIFEIDRGRKSSTVNTKLKTLKPFFDYALDEGYIKVNPSRSIKLLKNEKAVFTVFNDNEVLKMIGYWKGASYTAIKNKLVISMLVDTGIRIGELTSLLFDDVQDNCIKVHGKGNKWRIVPISPQLRKLMLKYERKRKEILAKNSKESDYYFINQYKNKIDAVSSFQKMIKYTAIKAGVRDSVRASPHTFRHYYVIKSLSLGTPIYQVSKNIGHESIKTTEIYLKQITNEQVVNEQIQKTISPLSHL